MNIKDNLKELKAIREFREVKAKRARIDLYKQVEKRRLKTQKIVLAVLKKKISRDEYLHLEYLIRIKSHLKYSKEMNWILQSKTSDQDYINDSQIEWISISDREVAKKARQEIKNFKESEKLRLKKKLLREKIETYEKLREEKYSNYSYASRIQKEMKEVSIGRNHLIKEIQDLESKVN